MRRPPYPAVLWALLIFGSSCTVIHQRALVRFTTDSLHINDFALFWGAVWWFVVKGWHFTEYAILVTMLRRRMDQLPAAAIAIGFAITDEWHQTFVPERGGTWVDVVIDSAGVLTALAIFHMLRRRREEPLVLAALEGRAPARP